MVYQSWLNSASADATNAQLSIERYKYELLESEVEGLRRLANGSCHFAVLDAAPSPDDVAAMPNVWAVPTLAQGVAIVFNLPDENSLELNITREDLADIFLGRIRRWDELAKTNPGLASVRENITLIVRADESTVSKLFTSALSSFSREWKAKVGASTKPRWPRADSIRRSFDSGIAGEVLDTPYSLGYISDAYKRLTRVVPRVARISNKAGRFVLPTESSVVAAMDAFAWESLSARGPGQAVFCREIVDPPEDAQYGYPIAGTTYVAFNPARLDCLMLHDVMYLIAWAWTKPLAAAMARRMGLVPISAPVYKPLMDRMRNIRCQGKPALDSIMKELRPVPCPRGKQTRFLQVGSVGCTHS